MLQYAPYIAALVGLIGIGTILMRIGGNTATTASDLKSLNDRHSSLAKEIREGRASDSQQIAVMRTELSVLQTEVRQMRRELDDLKKEKASAESMAVITTAVQRMESGIFAVRRHLIDDKG